MDFESLSEREEELGKQIVASAYKIYNTLGAGLLERVYEICIRHELKLRGIATTNQEAVPIAYEDLFIEDALRLDVFVDSLVVCELNAADNWHPTWEAQLLTDLKLSQKRNGFIINVNVKRIKDGIRRMILQHPSWS
jgi:GxxExxY protein